MLHGADWYVASPEALVLPSEPAAAAPLLLCALALLREFPCRHPQEGDAVHSPPNTAYPDGQLSRSVQASGAVHVGGAPPQP